MKKLSFFLVLLISTFTLVACQSAPIIQSGDVKVQIADEFMTSNTLDVHAVIPYGFESIDDLYEVALSVVSMSYEKHFESIGITNYTMTIYFYQSLDHYEKVNASYGTMVFDINKDLNSPGLSLRTNGLKLK